MTRLQRALKLLRGADAELRELMVEAAGAGEYRELARLTEIAQQLGALAGSNDEAGSAAGPGVPAITVTAPRKPIKKYPAFFRRDDELIRVGWSKKTRREYRQAMPHKAVEAVVAALAKCGSEKKPRAVESLRPVKDADGNEVPIYEIYNTVAWLKAEGLIRKRGRKGYVVLSVDRLEATIGKTWERLQHYV